MKIKILLLLIIICIPTISLAQTETIEQSEILESQQKTLNISSFIEEAKKYSSNVYKDIDFNELFNLAITGNINNKTIINDILKILGKEIVGSVAVIGSIILIIIIHSIFKSLSEGLENKTISQITYYIQYILIVTLIMTNFSNILIMIKESIQNLVGFSNTLIPILITLMLATGSITSAGVIQPILMFIITFIGNMISSILLPIVLVATALSIISKVSDKVQIDKLSKFLKSSVVWILGVILTIFVGLISVEGSLSSSVDGITAKTTKAAVSSFIPVVGKILRRCSRYSNRL